MDVKSKPAAPGVTPTKRPVTTPTAPEKPLEGARRVTPDASLSKAGDLPDPKAIVADIPEVDFSAVEAKPAAPPPEPPFYKKALDFFMKAISFSPLLPFNAAVSAGMAIYETFAKNPDLKPEVKNAIKDMALKGLLSAADGKGPAAETVVSRLLAAGADSTLIEQILGQVTHPDGITQIEGKNTCPTAVVQKVLAQMNPGAYVQIAHDLATTGKATLPDGTDISISEENRAWIEKQNLSPEAKVNALFQVALAEKVAAPDKYNVATDTVEKSVSVFGMQVAGWNDSDGFDFKDVLGVYAQSGIPIFDPRTAGEDRQAALRDALAKSGGHEAGLSLPIVAPSAEGSAPYHMVEVFPTEDPNVVQMRDPATGEVTRHTLEELEKMVGWDIGDYSNVGNRGGRPGTSSGGSTEIGK